MTLWARIPRTNRPPRKPTTTTRSSLAEPLPTAPCPGGQPRPALPRPHPWLENLGSPFKAGPAESSGWKGILGSSFLTISFVDEGCWVQDQLPWVGTLYVCLYKCTRVIIDFVFNRKG